MPKPFVPIIMGSGKDIDHARKIGNVLNDWQVEGEYRVCSAHKNSPYLMKMLEEYDSDTGLSIVYITIAGRSDGLSGTVAGHTTRPVIGCPPYSEKYSGMSAISTFYMPSKASVLFVPEPENAALAAIRIFALSDERLANDLKDYMLGTKAEIELADQGGKKGFGE